MGRTLPPRSDAPRTPESKAAKLAKREATGTSTGTSRAGAARRRTGLHPESAPASASASASDKPAHRRTDRASRPPATQRPATERDLALRMLDALKAGTDVRARKIRRLKAAIKVRAYENELKFQVAFERMVGTTR